MQNKNFLPLFQPRIHLHNQIRMTSPISKFFQEIIFAEAISEDCDHAVGNLEQRAAREYADGWQLTVKWL